MPGPTAAALERARRTAEALMVDACTVRRKTGQTTDQSTGRITPTYATLYTGKCRVQQASAAVSGSPSSAGEASLVVLRMEVQLPMSVTGLRVDDEIVITASWHDPDLVNRRFVVKVLSHKTHATSRRPQVEEVTG